MSDGRLPLAQNFTHAVWLERFNARAKVRAS
jgi:hypothetical protein